MAASKEIYLVLGGTGKVGSAAVAGLKLKGIADDQVRVASRHPKPDSNHIKFDWDDESTWEAALKGVSALMIIGPDSLDGSVEKMKKLVDRALAAGVKRQVLFTGMSLELDDIFWGQVHRHVVDNVPEYFVLRPTMLSQNFIKGGWFNEMVKDGQFTDAAGDSKCGFVDSADVGAAAAEALTLPSDSPLVNYDKGYMLEGPIAYDYATIAEIISRVSGKKIRYNNISAEQMRANRPASMAPMIVELMDIIYEIQISGRAALLTDRGFQKLTGREPKSFEVWAEENKEAFAALK